MKHYRPPGRNWLNSSSSSIGSSCSSTARPPRLATAYPLLHNNLQSHHAQKGIKPLSLLAASRRSPFAASSAAASSSSNARVSSNNPDLDDVELDEAYYSEIGMTREQAMQQQRDMMFALDPEAVALDDLASVDASALPDEWRKAIENLEVYGPQALVMAGFRAEEYAVARSLLDSLGAADIKVLPVSEQMLQAPLAVALAEPEVDWSAPRPPDWIMGGAWGSQRTILFSGLSVKVQATLLELLEGQGLPQQVSVSMALQEDAGRRLGEVLAAAVKAQRTTRAPTAAAPWDLPRRAQAAATTTSSTSSSSPAAPASIAGFSSAAATKASLRSGLPGKRGPLFAKKAGGSSSSRGGSGSGRVPAEGLESLQDLISPEMARARLTAIAPTGPGLSDLDELELLDEPEADDEPATSNSSSSSSPQRQQQQQEQQQRSPSQQPPAGSSSSSSDAAAPQQQSDSESQALLDWFQDESTGQAVELPWNYADDGQAAAAAAAAGAGFSPQQQPAAAAEEEVAVSLDDLLPPKAPPDSSSVSSSSSSFWNQQQQAGPSRTAGLQQPNQTVFQQQQQQQQQQQRQQAEPPSASAAAALAAAAAAREEAALEAQLAGPSVLTAIQAALRSGVDPEQLKKLIDAAAAAASAAADPVDLLLKADEQKADAAAAQRQRQPSVAQPQPQQQQQQQQQPKAYGPAPPPADVPLLKLRPEIERAFENNQIKFVDMNKLPSKYRKQYTLGGKQQQQQQRDAAAPVDQPGDVQQQQQEGGAGSTGQAVPAGQPQQRWWQRQRSAQQQALVQGLSAGVMGGLPGGRLVEVDAAGGEEVQQEGAASSSSSSSSVQTGGGWPAGAAAGMTPPKGNDGDGVGFGDVNNYDDGEGFGEAEEAPEEFEQALFLDEAKLQQLVETAREEGLDVGKTLAQAVAYGIQVDPEAVAALGFSMPSAEMIEEAQIEIVGSIEELQRQQAELDADADGEEAEDDEGEGEEGEEQQEFEDEYEEEYGEGDTDEADEGEVIDVAATDVSAASIKVGVSSSSSMRSSGGDGGRASGSGLSAAVVRAKARVAEKKRQQQLQQQEDS